MADMLDMYKVVFHEAVHNPLATPLEVGANCTSWMRSDELHLSADLAGHIVGRGPYWTVAVPMSNVRSVLCRMVANDIQMPLPPSSPVPPGEVVVELIEPPPAAPEPPALPKRKKGNK